MINANWEDGAECLNRERDDLAHVAAGANDAEEFDVVAKHAEGEMTLWDPDEGPVAAPDLGMFAACVTLCAAGCATAASCRGHPDKYAWSHEPVILFTADPARARRIEEVARATGCGLASLEGGRISLYAQSVEEVLAFAALMIERRAEFDALPLPSSLAAARLFSSAESPDPLTGQDPLP